MDTLEAIDSTGGNHSESGNNKDNAQSISISDDHPNMERGLQPNMAQVLDTLLVSVLSRSTLGLNLTDSGANIIRTQPFTPSFND